MSAVSWSDVCWRAGVLRSAGSRETAAAAAAAAADFCRVRQCNLIVSNTMFLRGNRPLGTDMTCSATNVGQFVSVNRRRTGTGSISCVGGAVSSTL